jgi:hypothetical protein
MIAFGILQSFHGASKFVCKGSVQAFMPGYRSHLLRHTTLFLVSLGIQLLMSLKENSSCFNDECFR